METILQKVLITVFSGLILAGVLYVLKLRFNMRPKLELKYVPGIKQSSSGENDKLRCEWQGELALYNPTPHDAFDVTFIFPASWSLPRPQLDPRHVGAKETKKVPFNVQKLFERSAAFPHENDHPRPDFNPPRVEPLRDFYPDDLKSFSLGIQYSNGHGLTFYNVLRRNDAEQTFSYHRLKPKI